MPCILIECFGPKRLTARVDALAVVLQRLLCRLGLFFGEQNIGVRAERRNRERLICSGFSRATRWMCSSCTRFLRTHRMAWLD